MSPVAQAIAISPAIGFFCAVSPLCSTAYAACRCTNGGTFPGVAHRRADSCPRRCPDQTSNQCALSSLTCRPTGGLERHLFALRHIGRESLWAGITIQIDIWGPGAL